MTQKQQRKNLMEALERSISCNILLLDAIFELLAERAFLRGRRSSRGSNN
jgi:hypothetical protein